MVNLIAASHRNSQVDASTTLPQYSLKRATSMAVDYTVQSMSWAKGSGVNT